MYEDERRINMLYICTACKYMFKKQRDTDRCPDCGRFAVREANAEETAEYEARMQIPDDWFDQKPLSYAEMAEWAKKAE